MKRLQNRIAESRKTFLWTAILTASVWTLAALATDQQTYLSMGLVVVATYLTFILNNRYTLMRIYSRMASVSLMVMTGCCLPFLVDSGAIGLAVACLMLLCYRMLFEAYQDKSAPGHVFAGFACIGMASLAEPQILFFVPLLWLLLKTKFMVLSPRTAVASLLGLLLPYWIYGCYNFVRFWDISWATAWWARLSAFSPVADFSDWSLPLWFSATFVLLFYVVGSLHFFQVSSNDSIKVRMFFHVFMTIGAGAVLMLAVQPQQSYWLLPVLMANTSFLIGHFITFTRTRLTNAFFILMTAVAAGLTLYHLWTL